MATRGSDKKFSKKKWRRQKDDPAFHDDSLPSLKKKQNSGISLVTKSFKSKKEEKEAKSGRGKAKYDFKVASLDRILTNKELDLFMKKRRPIISDRKQVGDNKTMVF